MLHQQGHVTYIFMLHQARDPILNLKNNALIYTSGFLRCMQTAQPLAEALDAPVAVHPDIYEVGGVVTAVSKSNRVILRLIDSAHCCASISSTDSRYGSICVHHTNSLS
eukprot:m.800735 g.800735  ORF g.800735 m.800735 type:complete len:109 (-) comp23357_c0_seq19:1631-1957(-)